MKRNLKFIVALLLATMLLTLVSCGSTFGAIKKNFEKKGEQKENEEH